MSNLSFIIRGEPASKANSRRMVFNPKTKKPMFIKSKKALEYEKMFKRQCWELDDLIEDDVSVTITIWYKTRRPDLDESLILDLMQGRIYANDRQVKEKHIYHRLDKEDPRAEIRVQTL